MLSTTTDIIVNREASRIMTRPFSQVSEIIVKANSNKSEAAKTRNNLISNCKTRKRKLGNFTPAKHLYIPKTYFEESQCFKIVQAENTSSVVSSNKERKRQLNWREFSVDLSGKCKTWEEIKSKESFSADLVYSNLDFDDDVVFQVIEPVIEEKQPKIVEVLGRRHVVDYNYESETKYTSLGTFKSSFRTFSQNVHQNFLNEMNTLNEENDTVILSGAHHDEIILGDDQETYSEEIYGLFPMAPSVLSNEEFESRFLTKNKVEKPVPLPRTVFFPNGFKKPVPTPRTSLNVSQGISFDIPPPVLDFDLVPEEKIFKNVLESFNEFDPLFLAVCQKKEKLVEASEIKPDLTFAASTSHHKSDVVSFSIKPKVEKKKIACSGSYYDFEPKHVGEYLYSGYDLSNPLYIFPKYVPSFGWNQRKNGKIERFAAVDFDEKKSKFEKVVKTKLTIFENMNSVVRGRRRQFLPTTKEVTFRVYLTQEEPLCKKCKGQGCIKCSFWGSPITVKPEKWFEELSPLDNSLSPKITALGVTLSKLDKVNEQ